MYDQPFLPDENKRVAGLYRHFVDKEIMPIRQQVDDDEEHVIIKRILQKLTDVGHQKAPSPPSAPAGRRLPEQPRDELVSPTGLWVPAEGGSLQAGALSPSSMARRVVSIVPALKGLPRYPAAPQARARSTSPSAA